MVDINQTFRSNKCNENYGNSASQIEVFKNGPCESDIGKNLSENQENCHKKSNFELKKLQRKHQILSL